MAEDADGQRRQRVVFVAHSHVVGGIERHVVELAGGLRERFEHAFTLDAMLEGTLRVYAVAARTTMSR